MQETALGLVIRGFGDFGRLVVEVLRKKDLEGRHWPSGMVRRFDLLDAIINLSSKVTARHPSRRAAAEEPQYNTDASNQREVKRAVSATAVGTALHKNEDSIIIVLHAKRYGMWMTGQNSG